MAAVLAILHASAIIFIGAFLFTAVDWLEPNRWVAIVFKCALPLRARPQSQISCCPEGCLRPSVWVDEIPLKLRSTSAPEWVSKFWTRLPRHLI
jgi:hypothetical protein